MCSCPSCSPRATYTCECHSKRMLIVICYSGVRRPCCVKQGVTECACPWRWNTQMVWVPYPWGKWETDRPFGRPKMDQRFVLILQPLRPVWRDPRHPPDGACGGQRERSFRRPRFLRLARTQLEGAMVWTERQGKVDYCWRKILSNCMQKFVFLRCVLPLHSVTPLRCYQKEMIFPLFSQCSHARLNLYYLES